MWSVMWVRTGVFGALNWVRSSESRWKNDEQSSSLLSHFFGVMSRRSLERISVIWDWNSGGREVEGALDKFWRSGSVDAGQGRAKQCRFFRFRLMNSRAWFLETLSTPAWAIKDFSR